MTRENMDFPSNIPAVLEEMFNEPMAFSTLEILEKNNETTLGTVGAPFTLDQLHEMTNYITNALVKIPNLANLGETFNDVVIAGDTHGDLHCTNRIIAPFLEGTQESMIFLGDYVDRGPDSLANFYLIAGLAATWPDRVRILRGNHEDFELNSVYGFIGELRRFYPDQAAFHEVILMVDKIYAVLSFAAITPQRSLCIHGGIPRSLGSIQPIGKLPKPYTGLDSKGFMAGTIRQAEWDELVALDGAAFQLRWNDPVIDEPRRFSSSFRGMGIFRFNEDATRDFLEASNCRRLIRAHESSRGGFQRLFNGKLLHVFSTEPYFGQVRRAHLIHERADGATHLLDLDHSFVEEIEGPSW